MENDAHFVRLIATDLDGTLLQRNGHISDYTLKALELAQKKGLSIVLASARAPTMIQPLAHLIGCAHYAICCNGAILYDLFAESITLHFPLEAHLAQEIVLELRQIMPEVCFAAVLGLQFAAEPAYLAFRPGFRRFMPRIEDASSFCQEAISLLLVSHPTLCVEELYSTIRHLGRDRFNSTTSGSPIVDITAAGVDKATTLAQLCASINIRREEVIAFGDMLNDLPLLRWAGHSVAVSNAHPQVLKLVNEITTSNDDDGVARVLMHLL